MQRIEGGHLQPELVSAQPVLPAAFQHVGEPDNELHMRIVALRAAAPIERLECFGMTAERMQRQAAIDVNGAALGSERQRAIEGGQGIRGAIALDQDRAAQGMRVGEMGLKCKRAVDAGHGFVES